MDNPEDPGRELRTRPRAWLNPLTGFVLFCWLVITVLTFGEDVATVAKLLFAPFLLDITKGVGAEPAAAFRWWVFASETIVIGLVIAHARARRVALRVGLFILGASALLAHYVCVALGYLSTGIH